MNCRIEETEDGMLRIYMPPDKNKQDIFKIAAQEGSQVRHFVQSQTSLEDLFADVVGVD
jgi:ABC-type uncharacterized transport system ATPase subunit